MTYIRLKIEKKILFSFTFHLNAPKCRQHHNSYTCFTTIKYISENEIENLVVIYQNEKKKNLKA